MSIDYYQLLGVARDASAEEIKSAFRRLSKELHPDTGNPGDVERFRSIRAAYETLADPERRRSYDAVGAGPGAHVSPVSWTSGFEQPLAPFRELRRRREAAVPAHLDILLSEEEAMRGGEARLEVVQDVPCAHCNGTGHAFFGWCEGCGGNGWLRMRERIAFAIPRGVEHGEVLSARLSNGASVVAQVRIGRSAWTLD